MIVDIDDDVIPDMNGDEEAKIGKKDSNSNTIKLVHLDPKVEKYRVKMIFTKRSIIRIINLIETILTTKYIITINI